MSYIYSQISTKFTANMSHDKQDAIEVDIRPDKILLIKWGGGGRWHSFPPFLVRRGLINEHFVKVQFSFSSKAKMTWFICQSHCLDLNILRFSLISNIHAKSMSALWIILNLTQNSSVQGDLKNASVNC